MQNLNLSLSLSPISPLEQQQQQKQKQKQKQKQQEEQEDPKNSPCWTLKEHENFLRGVQKHGIGMWKQIAEDYVPGKTAEEISAHAHTFFNKTEVVHDIAITIAAISIIRNHMEAYKNLKMKLAVEDDHHKDDKDDDDVIVLDSAPDLRPRKVKRTTMELLPKVAVDCASSSGKQKAEEGKEQEGEDDRTMNLFPTHPMHI